jgi:translation initiation factor IF-1
MGTEHTDQHMEFEGEVVSSIKGIMLVQIDSGQQIQCHISGRIRKNKINVVVGDRVRVKVTPYDMTKGFITFRL